MNDRLRIMQRQPRRISITLSYHVHESLLQRSEEEGRSMSNLCAFLLEDALRHQNGQPLLNGNGHSAIHNGQEARTRQRSPF
jgi:macrodomain Ter protein organizer (MatP/YcbG family)